MHNRFTKLILVGTLVVVVAAIAAGGASARALTTGPIEQSTALPGYSDFPEVVRTMKDAATPTRLAPPGLSDFPEVVRTMKDAATPTRLAPPGLSDFPEVVRSMKDTTTTVQGENGSDWGTAGAAVGIVVVLASIVALFSVRIRRRHAASAST